jgi:anti-sigma28 factor (negative regulator of flagellin synthesis)
MKIDDRVSNYMAFMQAAVAKEKHPSGEVAGTTEASGSSPTEVDLSATAVQLADDEARRARLISIRQQLAEGSYNISGKDVASKILSVIKG